MGGVDYGAGPIQDKLARNALVLLLVGLRGRWKVPVAYFFTDHVTGGQLAATIESSVELATNAGLNVKAVVADGTSVNFTAAKVLGVSIPANLADLCPSFECPKGSGRCLVWVADVCHMMKLMRNLLHDYQEIYVMGRAIKWSYIQELFKLQETDSFVLSNKLSRRHIYYSRCIMKVGVAAQTLSRSVADAIDFLREDMKLPQFLGSEATTAFLRRIDCLFDILNSRHPCGRAFKAPLRLSSREVWEPFLKETRAYLLSLCDMSGKPIFATPKRTAVVGFCLTIDSVCLLAIDLLNNSNFSFFLTYKISQDHIELLFSKIRRRGGWCNNPTVSHFTAAIRALLLSNAVRASINANVRESDEEQEITLDFRRSRRLLSDTYPAPVRLDTDSEQQVSVDLLSERLSRLNDLPDTDWRANVLYYTAGYVAKRVAKKIACHECSTALFYREGDDDAGLLPCASFLLRRHRGGLHLPSIGCFKLVEAAEQSFRILFPGCDNVTVLPAGKNIDLKIEHAVLSVIDVHSLFPQLDTHFFDYSFEDDSSHVYKLIRCIVNYFVRVRLFRYGKLFYRRRIFSLSHASRQQGTKLMLFRGQ